MTEYNREILSLYVKPEKDTLKNVVTRVTWRYRARDEAHFADVYKDTYFDSVNPNSFMNFEDLTDQIVFGWIDAVEDIDSLTQELGQRLESAKNPVMVEKKIPWTQESVYTGEEEYLIVVDDEPNDPLKIWGPMRWSSERANQGLRERGVHDYEFPADVVMYQRELLPVDQPLVVTQRVKLYRVQFTEQPVLDDRFQYHEGLTWVVESGKAVGTWFVLDRELHESKKMMQTQLSNASFQKQVSGTEIELDGETLPVNSDLVSRVTLMQRWSLMADSDQINHKINNTTWRSLTKSECAQVLNAMDLHITSVLDWEKMLFDQIDQAENVDQLKTIEI